MGRDEWGGIRRLRLQRSKLSHSKQPNVGSEPPLNTTIPTHRPNCAKYTRTRYREENALLPALPSKSERSASIVSSGGLHAANRLLPWATARWFYPAFWRHADTRATPATPIRHTSAWLWLSNP
ncbi:unnamed protein product, partial [Nesidiocoris tenuis]